MKNTAVKGMAVLLLCGLLIPLLPSCGRPAAYTVTYLDAFDTVLTVTVGAADHAEASAHAGAIHDIVLGLHRALDIYQVGSGLYTLNHTDNVPVSVSQDIMEILLMGKDFYSRTGGRLNFCLGALTGLWHTARQTETLPDPNDLAWAAAHASPDALVLDKERMTATRTDPSMTVDVGALAKGYAMYLIYAYAKEAGIESMLVNLGGHILAVGDHPDGKPWEVALTNPDGGVLETVRVSNATVCTAGDYERAFTYDGRTYHHIIDPETGYPAAIHRAVTVVLPLDDILIKEADALATALFLLPQAQGEALLPGLPNVKALWISADGTITKTPNWES